MKNLPWILAAVGLGLAAYVVLSQPTERFATGSPDVDDATDSVSGWGTKQRVKGTGGSVLGKAKEGLGNLTGDDTLAGEGLVDQVTGAVKDTAGQAAHAVSDTIHDLNK